MDDLNYLKNQLENDINYENYSKDNNNKHQRKGNKFKLFLVILITSLVNSSIIGGILYNAFSDKLDKELANTDLQNRNKNSSQEEVATGMDNSKESFPINKVVKKVAPSIVGTKITTNTDQPNDLFGMFGEYENKEHTVSIEGSGIIISENGYILTNYHVVSNADNQNSVAKQTKLEVYLPISKKKIKAKFVRGDSNTDLALIKVDFYNLPIAKLGNSSEVKVGDTVIAIGNPLGIEFAGSVTSGIVSALNRSVTSEYMSQKLIQTDAAMNSGNSGGALLNLRGEVIGINSVKIIDTGVEGLGFAIPINEAKPLIEGLKKNGKIKHIN